MIMTAKIKHKGQVTIPTRVREQAGLSKGDLVEFSFQRGKIVITPKLVIDRSQFPKADDEYTRDLPFFPALRKGLVELVAQRFERLLKLVPDNIDLGIV